MNPTGLFDLEQTILDCVCAQMAEMAETVEDYPGCPCVQYVSAGEPSLDCCVSDCETGGQLTVHFEDFYPSEVFPNASTAFEPCKAATWVAAIVVTSARCAPTMSEIGEDADPADQTANARLMSLDSYAITTALGCCVVADALPAKRKRRVLIQGSRPVTTSGGCAAIEVRALVEVGQVCACGQGS